MSLLGTFLTGSAISIQGLFPRLILIIIFQRNGFKNKKMTREGNLLTSNQFGTFGFLQSGSLDDEPLVLLDFGLEAR